MSTFRLGDYSWTLDDSEDPTDVARRMLDAYKSHTLTEVKVFTHATVRMIVNPSAIPYWYVEGAEDVPLDDADDFIPERAY